MTTDIWFVTFWETKNRNLHGQRKYTFVECPNELVAERVKDFVIQDALKNYGSARLLNCEIHHGPKLPEYWHKPSWTQDQIWYKQALESSLDSFENLLKFN